MPLRTLLFYALIVALGAACAPAAPSPTAPPPKPTEAPKPAEAKPAAKPTEAPAAKPGEAKPTAAAAKPTEAPKPAAAVTLTEAEKADAESFYKGKTVRLLVGFAAGGGYDLFARVTSKYLSKYLPGNPSVLVENMTGAGSLTLANHLYNVAPKDGTQLGTFDPALIFVQAVGGQAGAIQFQPKEYPWLGSPTVSTNQCMGRVASGADSLEKILSSQKEIIFGATSLGNSTSIQPSLMKEYLGAKIRIVTGYDGVNTIKLAVERGEADAMCGTWETFRSTHAEWLKGNPPFARVISKGKPDPAGELKDVPLLGDFLKTEEAKQILDMAMASQAAGFVYAAPPGTPPVRLKALRAGLIQAWNDPEFRAESQKSNLAAIPQDYQVIERLFDQILSAPPDRLKKAKEVLGIQ